MIEPLSKKIPASLVRRFCAFLIDCIIIGIFVALFIFVLINHFEYIIKKRFWLKIILLGFICMYYSSFESSQWLATPGKKIFGLIVRSKAGQQLNFYHAAYRYMLYLLPQLILIAIATQFPITNKLYSAAKVLGIPSAIASFLGMSSVDLLMHISNMVYRLISCMWRVACDVLLLISPFFFTKDKLLLHDLLSHTRVLFCVKKQR